MLKKPSLIVCNTFPDPKAGSERGKAFVWTLALSQYFDVHVFCVEEHADACRADPRCAEWNFHGIPFEYYPEGKVGVWWRDWFPRWRKLVIEVIREEIPNIQPVGLYHPTPGNFRILPAYQSLGIPYALGPLGGGEFAPWSLLCGAHLPPHVFVLEALRPLINRLSVLHPWSCPVLRNARKVLVTTAESEAIVRFAGATETVVTFPDVFEPRNSSEMNAHRKAQAAKFQNGPMKLLFSGRAVWWKAGHIALEVLKELQERGVPAHLQLFTEGPARKAWEEYALKLGVSDAATWSYFISREELQLHLQEAHAYVYPTLHDSSSSALPEAYATGLPSITFGIGGASTASGPGVGYNQYHPPVSKWVKAAVDKLCLWRNDPEEWLEISQRCLDRSRDFSQKSIESAVKQSIVPCFMSC